MALLLHVVLPNMFKYLIFLLKFYSLHTMLVLTFFLEYFLLAFILDYVPLSFFWSDFLSFFSDYFKSQVSIRAS